MVKLTVELVTEEKKGTPPSSVKELSFTKKDLHEIGRLDALANLTRLDLSQNHLQSIEALSACKNLKWLSVANNELKSLHGVETLSNLMVLNGSRNQLTSMEEVKFLVDLRAVILNDNQIKSVCKLKKLKDLNTLVLSRNPISSIGKSLKKVSSLVKLSLSTCEIEEVDWLKGLVALKELRLTHNKIKGLPEHMKTKSQLHIIDLGSNHIQSFSDIKVLGLLPRLYNLSLLGNPLCLQSSYQDEVREMLPNLRVLDGHTIGVGKKGQKKEDISLQNIENGPKSEKEDSEKPKKHGEKRKKTEMVKGNKEDAAEEPLVEEHDTDINNQKLTKKVNKKLDDGGLNSHKAGTKSLGAKEDKNKLAHAVVTGVDEEKPFIELIADKEQELPSYLPKKTNKDDSGIVSLKEKKRGSKHKTAPVFSLALEEVNVGAGGPSSWDM